MLKDLIQMYKEFPPDLLLQDRVRLEIKIWDEFQKTIPRGERSPRYGDWMRENLGGTTGDLEQRAALYRAKWAHILWGELNTGRMTVHIATKLYREVKLRVKRGGVEDECGVEVLAEYRSGKLPFQNTIVKSPRKKKAPKAKPKKVMPPEWTDFIKESKSLETKLNGDLCGFVNERLSMLDESIRQELVADFMLGVRCSYEDLLRSMSRFIKQALETEKLTSWWKTTNAFDVLNVEHKDKKGNINYEGARRAQRILAARFHPDNNNGSDKTLKQYRAVVEAWETIKSYKDQHED